MTDDNLPTSLFFFFFCSNIDDETDSLSMLTPENLVQCTAKCIQLIQPDLDVPKHLPPGIAQRYGVTTNLSEACKVSYWLSSLYSPFSTKSLILFTENRVSW